MFKLNYLTFIALLFLMISCDNSSVLKNDIVFQTSTFDALLSGNYEGTINFSELAKKGDFGIGTFNELDGEMIALDGTFYQIKSDGQVYPVEQDMMTPFAVVTNFIADTTFQLSNNFNFKQLNDFIDQLIPSKNIFYAIKIEGDFEKVITRSVPKQTKPYPDLIEVVKNQPLFEFNSQNGVLVGFRVPEFLEGINVPAYHYHYLNEGKSEGGHLLECVLTEVTISIDWIHQTQILLPNTKTFYQLNLLKDRSKESEMVER